MRMKRWLIAVSLALAAASATAQEPRVASLDWLAGTWVRDDGGEKVTESWVGPGNGTMVAANLTTWPSGKRTYEFLRIADTPQGMTYFASPGGRPPVEFRLIEAGDQRVAFENLAHDYPQRISYWREGPSLVARIEGTLRGQKRSEEWRFRPN
jgi:hypothetical protein